MTRNVRTGPTPSALAMIAISPTDTLARHSGTRPPPLCLRAAAPAVALVSEEKNAHSCVRFGRAVASCSGHGQPSRRDPVACVRREQAKAPGALAPSATEMPAERLVAAVVRDLLAQVSRSTGRVGAPYAARGEVAR